MSSAGKRTRQLTQKRNPGSRCFVTEWTENGGSCPGVADVLVGTGKQITVSESHPRDRNGAYREGGPFFTSRVEHYRKCPTVVNAHDPSTSTFYTGPVCGSPPTLTEMKELGYSNPEDKDPSGSSESDMIQDGTTAISLCNPVNSASKLGTTLAESMREGIPSLPGIELWRAKTQFLKGLGSEYLNYQFGWAPLKDEVESVRDAARQHRDLLKQYQRGEGSDTHRTFNFPLISSSASLPLKSGSQVGKLEGLPWAQNRPNGARQVFRVTKTKKWFEGVFTYGLPSSTDSWRKALGFGSDADRLFGIALSPDILWELTPWSWAVDWFSNTGMVINNITNFGLAGLVMRYGYMMVETTDDIYASGTIPSLYKCSLRWTTRPSGSKEKHYDDVEFDPGTYVSGVKTVTKQRIPASPFGFGIGWEGLSPTQLAITAALGITRLL